MTTATTIPTPVLEHFARACATIRAHNGHRAELVRVYGRERGLDEFRCLRDDARTAAALATARELLSMAKANGFTHAAMLTGGWLVSN